MKKSIGTQNKAESEIIHGYFNGIFDRQYYTESGPLVRRLEANIGRRVGVEHVVCVSNASVAWIMLLETGLTSRRLILPATVSRPIWEAISWMNCPYRICDISLVNGYRWHYNDIAIDFEEGYDALVGVNPWGGACDTQGLSQLAEAYSIPLYLDSSEAFACHQESGAIGSLGQAEIFSFDCSNLIYGAGGACICTHDEALADRLRCMRGSGGVVRKVAISKTVNGRMSEAQAAYALMRLDQLDDKIGQNRERHILYEHYLSRLPGLRFLSAQGVLDSNYQQAVITLESASMRDGLVSHLERLGFKVSALRCAFNPISNASGDFPGLSSLENTAIALPLDGDMESIDIQNICEVISALYSPRNVHPHRRIRHLAKYRSMMKTD